MRRSATLTHSRRSLPAAIAESLEQRTMLFAGNLLVAAPNDNDPSTIQLRTYTQTGVFQGSINMPAIPGADGSARDLVVGPNGALQVFTGTFSPELATQTQPGGAFVAHTTPGWSVVGRTFYGGVAAIDNYVFVTDMSTANAGAAQGLIRFDMSNNFAVTRFSSDVDICDVTIGLDGNVYAMVSPLGQPSSGAVRVYNPKTLKLIRTVRLTDSDDAAAVGDAAGDIYTGAFGGDLRKLSPSGAVLKDVPIGATDLDIASDGTLMAVSGGTVYLLDSNLNQITSFIAPSFTGADFAAFATYQPPVNEQPGSITGKVFSDPNGNGVQDSGEPVLKNWSAFLDLNNNGVHDSSDVLASTDSNGNYTFSNLKPGTYHVLLNTPVGWHRTLPTGLTNGYTVTVQAATVSGGKNFAFQKDGSISAHFFNDFNENGVQDSGEPALAGWTAFADINKNGVYNAGVDVQSITGPLGNLTLSNLVPGTYRVIPSAMSGWKRTTPASVPVSVTVISAQTTALKFGEAQAAISGYVFNDSNRSGSRDPLEAGIPGVSVYLDLNNDHIFDGSDVKVTTDDFGFYRFTGLAAGTYHVIEVLPAGYTRTQPGANGYTITISAGQLATAENFGNHAVP